MATKRVMMAAKVVPIANSSQRYRCHSSRGTLDEEIHDVGGAVGGHVEKQSETKIQRQ
jgi:hypothetical protein